MKNNCFVLNSELKGSEFNNPVAHSYILVRISLFTRGTLRGGGGSGCGSELLFK